MPQLDNPKRERFCREYVKDLNATQAYIRAGYAEGGAEQNASRLMTDDKVRMRIAELQEKVSAKLEITQESVLREIAETQKKAADADQHATALRAIELKGKHIGMWPQKSELTVRRIGDLDDEHLDRLDRLLEMVSAGDSGDPGRDKSRAH